MYRQILKELTVTYCSDLMNQFLDIRCLLFCSGSVCGHTVSDDDQKPRDVRVTVSASRLDDVINQFQPLLIHTTKTD